MAAHREWPASSVPRASLNSFGFGGANSHAILEAASAHTPMPSGCNITSSSHHIFSEGNENDTLTLLTFSARTELSLRRMVGAFAEYASNRGEHTDLQYLAYTLNCRRSKLCTRGYLLASQSSLKNGIDSSKLGVSNTDCSSKLPLCFVYTGQGAQWPGVGRQLMLRYPRFRKSIEYLDSCLQALDKDDTPSWSIEATILGPAEATDIYLAEKSQPVCTAVQIAATDLLQEWNILPKTVVGHSSGEIGAAYAAGHLTACQAITVAYCRGLAVSRSQNTGAMLAVGLSQSEAQKFIDELPLQQSVNVACINSPEASTLSGDTTAIDKLYDILQGQKIFARRLETNGKAYHSHHMKGVGASYQSMLEPFWHGPSNSPSGLPNVTTKEVTEGIMHGPTNALRDGTGTSVRMVSTVTGCDAIPGQIGSPAYWRANLESPVRFETAVRSVLESENYHFIEVGPSSALELPIKQIATTMCNTQNHYLYSPTLIRNTDAAVTTLNLIGSLFVHGHDEILYENLILGGPSTAIKKPKLLLDLPTYPWDYTEPNLWNESRNSIEFRSRRYLRHNLLGSQVSGGSKLTTTWRNIIDLNEVSWLKDHCLGPSIVFPAAAYLTMAIEALCQVSELQLDQCPGIDLRNFNFLKALNFRPEQKERIEVLTEMRQVQISSTTASRRWWHISIVSIADDGAHSTTHANGLASLSDKPPTSIHRQIQLDRNNLEQQASRVWYDKFTKEGLNWGPQFAVMEEIFCDRMRKPHHAAATTHLLRADKSNLGAHPQYIVHPISIDSMLQTAFVATTGGWVGQLRATVPVTMDSIHISSPAMMDMDTAQKWSIDSVSERVGFGTVKIDAELHNASDQVLVRMNNVRCIAYQGNEKSETLKERNPLVRVAWKPDINALEAGSNRGFSNYLDWFVESRKVREMTAVADSMRLAGALDLVVHKRPNLRILELGGTSELTALFMETLRAQSSLRRYSSYVKGSISLGG